MSTRAFVVAIDGPAAAGKGTIARALARHFGFAHLDTGVLYRATAARTLAEGLELSEAPRIAASLQPADLTRADLRAEATGEAASIIAANPAVRQALLAWQRAFAANPPDGQGGIAAGAVLDGRDIGTVICPDAPVKIFVDARPEVRAQRRWAEEREAGRNPDLAAILADVRARDTRDRNRADAPLRPADDAVLLDTSDLSIDAAIARAIAIVANVKGG